MPVVGEAHIIVRAITTGVARDIQNGFNGVSGSSAGKAATKAGQDMANKFSQAFNSAGNPFSGLAAGMRAVHPEAKQAYDAINQLVVAGYKGTTMAGLLVGSIGALIGGLLALVGAAGGAAAALGGLIGVFLSLKVASAVTKFAFNGIGEAVSNATQLQKNYGKTLREIREELQQLKFDAEEAALSEEQAAINLEKAREGLARTADLPADSRARREAELAFKQADLAYRRAKDRTKDLNEEVAKGGSGGGNKMEDPYAGLTASQKKFAQFLVKLQPILEDLREAVAKGFLPALERNLDSFIKSGSFDILITGITRVGYALGRATDSIFTFLKSADGAKYMSMIFSSIGYVIEKFGPIMDQLFTALFKILGNSGPIIREFADFLLTLLTNFNTFLSGFSDTEMQEFFTTAGDMAGKFGKIFGNIFGGLVEVISANFGEGTGGWMLLEWLESATEGFGTLGMSGDTLKEFFVSVAGNMIKMFSGLGALIGEIVKLGADPAIGTFWETIKESAPAFGSILKKANQSLPTIAKLFNSLVRIFDILTDSVAVDNFFKVLLVGAETFENIISNPVVKSVQEFTGRIHALVLGFNAVKEKADMVFGFMFQSVTNVTDTVGGFIDKFQGVKEAFTIAGDAGSGMADNIKKTIDSFKDAAKNADAYAAGVKRARDFTGTLGGKHGSFITNASAGTRKLLSSNNGLVRSFGNLRLGVETANLRFKIFQASSIAGFDKMIASNNKLTQSLGQMGKFVVGHPILIVIMLLVAAFALLYTNNEKFRESINNIMGPALTALGEMFTRIMVAIQPLIVAVSDLFTLLFGGTDGSGGPIAKVLEVIVTVLAKIIEILAPIIAQIVEILAPILVKVIELLMPIITIIMGFVEKLFTVLGMFAGFLFEIIGNIIGVLMNVLMPVINSIMGVLMPVIDILINMWTLVGAFWEALFSGNWEKFGEIFKSIGQLIVQGLADLFVGAINLIVSLLNGLIQLMTGWLKPAFDLVKDLTGGAVDIGGAIDAGLIPSVPRIIVPQLFAKGGIVSPSPGGTLGIVAEAGRPERIEPLDENGMSKRDKAMIDYMSNGASGGGGMNITINAAPGMDVNTLANEVSRRIAFNMGRGKTA
jgi:phage-related protein